MNPAAGVQTTDAAPEQKIPSPRAVAFATIAHELRQPLSAIESIAYYLEMVLPRHDDRAREQVSRLQCLVEQTNWILACGVQLLDAAPLSPVAMDLEELITQTVAAGAGSADPSPRLDLAGGLP